MTDNSIDQGYNNTTGQNKKKIACYINRLSKQNFGMIENY